MPDPPEAPGGSEVIAGTIGPWPPLPFAEWAGTKQTLHRYAQTVGKIRMALVPFRNHWWHVTLYADTRGLTTGPMPLPDGRNLEIAFDFVDHRLAVKTSDGDLESFDLRNGLACMDFYGQLFAILEKLAVSVNIYPAPYDLDGPLLSEDRVHDEYDAEAVVKYWTVLRRTTDVLNKLAGRFNGKQSRPQLFWHGFDLALGRYSGRPAPPRPGADRVTVEAYSHEVISFGFWPGSSKSPEPSFYSYTAPAPPGLTDQALSPAAAWWNEEAGTAYLAYDAVRGAENPEETLMGFFESAYTAGASTAGWDIEAFSTAVARPSA